MQDHLRTCISPLTLPSHHYFCRGIKPRTSGVPKAFFLKAAVSVTGALLLASLPSRKTPKRSQNSKPSPGSKNITRRTAKTVREAIHRLHDRLRSSRDI